MHLRLTVALTGLLAVLLAVGGLHFARDRGIFGCGYANRDGEATLALAQEPPRVRVRIGEGVRLGRQAGGLRDVTVQGGAGLAAGTQNGVRDYVYRVTATGKAVIRARTADGRVISGRVSAHC